MIKIVLLSENFQLSVSHDAFTDLLYCNSHFSFSLSFYHILNYHLSHQHIAVVNLSVFHRRQNTLFMNIPRQERGAVLHMHC